MTDLDLTALGAESAEALIGKLTERAERAEAEAARNMRFIGDILSAVPLRDTLRAGATVADLVQYFKDEFANIARLRSLLARAGEALAPFARRGEGWPNNHDTARVSVRLGELRAANTIAREIEEAIGHAP